MTDADEKEIELKKLTLERTKVRWNAGAVVVSVLTAGLTVGYGAWSTHRTAQDQLVTKIADIVFSPDSPDASASKAGAIAYLFSEELPQDLKVKMDDSEDLRKKIYEKGGIGENSGDKLTLLKLILAAKPEEEGRIVSDWKSMFSGDTGWVDEYLQNARKSSPPKSAPSRTADK